MGAAKVYFRGFFMLKFYYFNPIKKYIIKNEK
ncbi:hypothetical protein SAMN05421785_107150 [Chryseobacterium gambrini]|uniref:Uncharacterized protein n=1 Tax=Chryseobacterium gambrini TaxID=373672 RepID=A0A1N7PRM4_9FLAO|nr:hypothetical protein SAMN05421785_107150 [Chryseobacterium gambrini]